MSEIQTAYIAGLLTPQGIWSSNYAIDYLANVRNMVRAGIEVLKLGIDPFIPALDFVMFLCLRNSERITEPQIKRFSKTWLSKCDCVVLTKGWKKSRGTLKEIEFAKQLGIPVFKNIQKLKEYINEPTDTD